MKSRAVRGVFCALSRFTHMATVVSPWYGTESGLVYLDAFCNDEHFVKYLPEYKNLDELKAHYQRGGLGDMKVKKFLNSILQAELEPIRNKRKEYENNIDYVYNVLKEGCESAREIASQTLREVKAAMKLNYFDNEEFLNELHSRFAK